MTDDPSASDFQDVEVGPELRKINQRLLHLAGGEGGDEENGPKSGWQGQLLPKSPQFSSALLEVAMTVVWVFMFRCFQPFFLYSVCFWKVYKNTLQNQRFPTTEMASFSIYNINILF